MTWMNTYDVDEAYNRLREHKVIGPAVEILKRLRDAVNSCSDGWHCWQKPTKAAKLLMNLIYPAVNARGPRDDITVEAIREAVAPIKEFVQWCKDNPNRFMPGHPFVMTLEEIEIILGERNTRLVSEAIKKLAVEAQMVQNTSNLSGISNRFPGVMLDLRLAMQAANLPCSTDILASHAITRVWLDKMSSLAGIQNIGDPKIIAAHHEVDLLAAAEDGKVVVAST